MQTLEFILMAGPVVGLVALLVAMHCAPEGYEDAHGFHRSVTLLPAPEISFAARPWPADEDVETPENALELQR